MDPPVAAAIVTATTTVLVALYAGFAGQRKEKQIKDLESKLRQEESAAEREAEAETVLERYRVPLVSAAFDLQERLDNIIDRKRVFLAAYGRRGGPRHDDAIKSTLYRVAQWFAWTEILRRDIQLLRFREPAERRAVTELFGDVARTFASDRYGADFMVWYEEQRAIGERMIERDGDAKTCVGYATFVERYDESYARWLGRFEEALTPLRAAHSSRLVALRDKLRSLVERLDPNQEQYVRRWQRTGSSASG
jgi:hypothetical protein